MSRLTEKIDWKVAILSSIIRKTKRGEETSKDKHRQVDRFETPST